MSEQIDETIIILADSLQPFLKYDEWLIKIPIPNDMYMMIGKLNFVNKSRDELEMVSACLLDLEDILRANSWTMNIKTIGSNFVIDNLKKVVPSLLVAITGPLEKPLRLWKRFWSKAGVMLSELVAGHHEENRPTFLNIVNRNSLDKVIYHDKPELKITKVEVTSSGLDNPFYEIISI